ncbi:DUF4429 domain-containing protein [Streptomyces milbemycinicus]|uniref:DUF4429 domain-containing protein n=1 Tax=Streptomyces milbemycinicus TaxID=476552 RepID=A0ABW8LLD1_9ACTN
MAELTQRAGTWSFDGDTVRIVPARDKRVNPVRQALGELAVPLEALAGIAYEPGRRTGRLRLKLREGADPFLQAAGGELPDAADPYQLPVESERAGVAEYLVDEVRQALLLEQVGSGPCDRYVLPGPSVPLSASAGDGTVFFDGEQIRLEWNWKTEQAKKSGGPRVFPVSDVEAVKWSPAKSLENGYLRFALVKVPTSAPPKYDPYAVVMYGFKRDLLMALVAAAVTARLPHPAGPPEPTDAVPVPADAAPVALAKAPAALGGGGGAGARTGHDGDRDGGEGEADHDALLRRLRELGELRRDGVLTEEEFTTVKQAVLRRF